MDRQGSFCNSEKMAVQAARTHADLEVALKGRPVDISREQRGLIDRECHGGLRGSSKEGERRVQWPLERDLCW